MIPLRASFRFILDCLSLALILPHFCPYGSTKVNNCNVRSTMPIIGLRFLKKFSCSLILFQTILTLKESSRQRPRSAMSRKTPGEVRARTCGTKSPSRSEALRFIDSSKSPSCRWGFGWVDKAQCFRSARRFGAAGSSPDFSRGFSRHGAPRPLSWTFFQCTLLSYPGQPSYSQY